MFFASNIKYLRNRRRFTQDDVASSLDMKRSTLSGYENEVAKPTIAVLVRLSDYYKIAIDTLIRVDLRELNDYQMHVLENGEDVFLRGGNIRILATTVDQSNNENIELVTEKAKAGYTRGYYDPEYISTLPVFQLPFLSKEKKYRTFRITGDSMLPIPDGAYITGEFVQDWKALKDETLCILLTNEGLVFKSIKNHINENGTIELISLNENYAPYEIEVNGIREIWKFTHYITDSLPEQEMTGEEISKTLKSIKDDVNEIRKIVLPPKTSST
jgi:transcriptional regulator with XRE-family HTH domain